MILSQLTSKKPIQSSASGKGARITQPRFAAIEQQTVATSEISRNVQEAAHGTGTVVTSVGTVVASIENTAEAGGMVNGAANRVRATAGSLSEAVDSFLRDAAAA